jgi:type IV pilus assembly protein PilA
MTSTRALRAGATVWDRGFTLVEVLIVVAMVGILATLAIVSFNKLVDSAGTSEAVAMIQNIRAAEEAHKAETLVYLGCSGCGANGCAPGAGDLTKYYPQTSGLPDDRKWHWVNPNHPDYGCWNMLHATADGAVRFGYSVVAGSPANAPPVTSLTTQPSWPAAQESWYVVQAAADRDGDLKYAIVVGTSFAFGSGSGLAVENDEE